MKKIINLCSFVFLAASLLAQNAEGNIVNKGDQMPAFTINSAKYGTIDSKSLKGKVALINIFATWCPPCQIELAEIEQTLWPEYKDNPTFVMLVVGREHNDEELAVYNNKKKFSFPLYPDPKREFTSLFAKQSIPRSYLVAKDGKIVYASVGFQKGDIKHVLELIEKLTK